VTLIAQAWPLATVHPAAATAALAFITCLPWLWRDRFPNAALAISGAGLIAVILLLRAYDWASAVTIVLLFFVAYDGDRRRSLLVGIATACVLAGVVVALIPVLERSDDLSAAGTRVLAALAALVVGDLVRSRLALRTAAREKAQREIDELRDRADRQATAERLRIARELHDSLAHALVAINVRSAVTAHLGVSTEAADALTEIKNVSAQALTDLRATLDVLRERDTPVPRDPVHGLDAVPRLLDHAQAAGLDTRADMSLNGTLVPGLVDHAGYRIVQESLTNVMRHADASCARVCVTAGNGTLTIDVTDDGRGTAERAPAGPGAGHGLHGMAERAAALGGTLTAGPRPGRGWQVHAVLPLTGTPR
jgi:signal transduction histidine kinase